MFAGKTRKELGEAIQGGGWDRGGCHTVLSGSASQSGVAGPNVALVGGVHCVERAGGIKEGGWVALDGLKQASRSLATWVSGQVNDSPKAVSWPIIQATNLPKPLKAGMEVSEEWVPYRVTRSSGSQSDRWKPTVSTVCVVAVRPAGYGEILIEAHMRPLGTALPTTTSHGSQLFLLQAHIQKDYHKFLRIADDVYASFKQIYSAESLGLVSDMYNTYDELVEDDDKSLTIFSRRNDVRFLIGSKGLSDRVRDTIRRNAGYDPNWVPCGMKTIARDYWSYHITLRHR
jgi:hypothetical protein